MYARLPRPHTLTRHGERRQNVGRHFFRLFIRPGVATQPHVRIPYVGTEYRSMALQRAVCRNTWTTIASIQFVLLPILLALQQSHTIGDGGTCSADPFTCSEHGWTEVGGARTILGLQPQRLVVGETSEIFISVKTAAKYHEQRLSLLLLTWLQTLQPHQVDIGHHRTLARCYVWRTHTPHTHYRT